MHPLNGYKAALIALMSFITGIFGIISTAQNATPSGSVILFGVCFLYEGLESFKESNESSNW